MYDREEALTLIAAADEQTIIAVATALAMEIEIPELPEDAEAIVRLAQVPEFGVLRARARASQETYYANLANGLAVQKAAVDQREIDYKRGWFGGIRYMLETLPSIVVGNLARAEVAERGDDPRTPRTPPWMQ